MLKPQQIPAFERYSAAVQMAKTQSQGSGYLNKFDHVAKDYHQEGFDEYFEYLTEENKELHLQKHEDEIAQDARKYQKH